MTSAENEEKPAVLFKDLNADDEEQEVTEIESLCMNCHENGMTRLMLTRIPFFKEVIISSFTCDECGFENREVQLGGKIQEKGIKYVLNVQSANDLNRQVVKSDAAMLAIPSLEFEHPPSRKAEINTIEGLIDAVKEGLEQDQPVRRALDSETADKIDKFIEKLTRLKDVEEPFQMILDDPSGNSFIENPVAPKKDEFLNVTHYTRTKAQDVQIGILVEDDGENEGQEKEDTNEIEEKNENEKLTDEVLSFKVNCPNCNAPCDTNMKMTDIPFFKEVLIMATTCDACGHRDNEVKSGTGIADEGTRIELRLTDSSDLSRDVLKSETCGMEIPELELVLEHGTLGGRFTTIEGLLNNIKDQLYNKNPFFAGDSAMSGTKSKLLEFCDKLDKVITGERLGVTIVLDDPAGNSYLQNVYAPDPDPEMKVIHYKRNYEQNETLGLNDMKTENYENDS